MIAGETVYVSLLTKGEEDAYGNKADVYSEFAPVENVLVGRADQSDETDRGTPDAVRADITFCFPREWTGELRGARVRRGGKEYEIIGDPMRYTDANLPPDIPWNIRTRAVYRDG